MNIEKLFAQLFGSRVTIARGRHNNGLGTFKKARSRWFWNTTANGTFNAGRNAEKRSRRALFGVRK